MGKQILFVIVYLSAVLVAGESLDAVLNANGHAKFAESIQDDPDLNTNMGAGDVVVYAPTDAAFDKRHLNHPFFRRDTLDTTTIQNSIQYGRLLEKPPSSNFSKRALPASSGSSAYQTFLDDPEQVNIGAGQNQCVVQQDVPSSSLPVISTGLGDKINVTSDDIDFDGGVIRPVDGYE